MYLRLSLRIAIGAQIIGASLAAQKGKNLPAMWETQVQSLGQEDPLEKGMATHSSILAWRIPWTEEPGGLQIGKGESPVQVLKNIAQGFLSSRYRL